VKQLVKARKKAVPIPREQSRPGLNGRSISILDISSLLLTTKNKVLEIEPRCKSEIHCRGKGVFFIEFQNVLDPIGPHFRISVFFSEFQFQYKYRRKSLCLNHLGG
jgi:hypothetical protein